MLDLDAHSLIMSELEKLPGMKMPASDTLMVCCPFHHDNSPSCGIYMAVGMQIPLGYFHCFGCGEKGHWNKLAKHVGLQEIADWQMTEGSSDHLRGRFNKLDNKLLGVGYRTLSGMMGTLGESSYLEWNVGQEWRTYPGHLLNALGGLALVDRLGSGKLTCFLPNVIKGRYYGGVKAYLTKQAYGSSYVNTKGEWTEDYGLLGYDLAHRLIRLKGLNFCAAVEGPRDMMRLIGEGIPAVAILGSKNFSPKKAQLIKKLGVDYLYPIGDNDEAGGQMRQRIKRVAEETGLLKVEPIRLPKEWDGEEVDMDPDNAPAEIMRELRGTLADIHGTKLLRAPRYLKTTV